MQVINIFSKRSKYFLKGFLGVLQGIVHEKRCLDACIVPSFHRWVKAPRPKTS